ncbi:tRNA pseudouridine(38-40) synthase TruA [Sphingobacterium sp. SRCM116780]|uniref:tRNA pseudouridine(38-40) synthase TruA n=1 Tax=Sphingobacterium sp. SRCM116780 TaxID=2907623 RepID=UPI001F3CA1EC|nr:tRNA pseudouridine(38-40) synthase TruA [Sphingobacterium sp. SRCM116780]UIR56042.1 tRNA pseudouridine(38-40) synthase TruA [Sphingobacterium sp. SRCM116780]
MEKIRFFIEIAYFGKNYHGWQIQNNAVSVQEKLNQALEILLRVPIETIGAGRTDAGVHAKQLFVHFDSDFSGILEKPDRFLHALNGLLPHDIAVKSIFPVHADAHARFDAVRRSYEYHLHFEKDPFIYAYSSYLRDIPDVEKMNKAAEFLLGKQDFSCFSKSNTQVFTNICTITRAEWVWEEKGKLVFHITADRFLRNMVRAVVGTLLEIGIKGKPISFMEEVIASQNRSMAGTSVPAQGLYLTEVAYPYLVN